MGGAVAGAPTWDRWPAHRMFPVYYHHLDVLGHVNHAVYFPFMETLRCDYYLAATGSLDPARLDIILAEASCRYLAPAFYGLDLLGEVAPARPLGRTSFTLLYRFRDVTGGPKVYARGKTVVVSYDYTTNRKKEIPQALRATLERDAVDPAAEGWA
jgi:acyl-CoA thioester hydrolase